MNVQAAVPRLRLKRATWRRRSAAWWTASDLLGVNESVSSVSQTARQAETAGESVSTSLSRGSEADGARRDWQISLGLQPADAHTQQHTHIYIEAAPYTAWELLGPLVSMNGRRRRRADCPTISVKHGIQNRVPRQLMEKEALQSFILIEEEWSVLWEKNSPSGTIIERWIPPLTTSSNYL